ncbi:hypothetical protein TNCV_4798721 [Trichonephila clavipes]|nr:hypothetical protein TNCV_4798721 [Trichonephila clavipes]
MRDLAKSQTYMGRPDSGSGIYRGGAGNETELDGGGKRDRKVCWRWNYDLGMSLVSWTGVHHGLGSMITTRGKLNADSYCTFKDKNVIPTLRQFYGLDHCYFQDDNVTCHVARSTRN